MLDKIISVKKIGRFEDMSVGNAVRFKPVTLIYGENGWGKSTIADIIRSRSTNNALPLISRETVALGGPQSCKLLIDNAQAEFADGAWSGRELKALVYDQTFINQNVYSGDIVLHDHMKRQYGFVVGERGVSLGEQSRQYDQETSETNRTIRELKQTLTTIIQENQFPLDVDAFVALEEIDNVDTLIENKKAELARAQRAGDIKDLKALSEVPLPSASGSLSETLRKTIEDIAAEAQQRVREHIEDHQPASIEQWLSEGSNFDTETNCPFCGQILDDRSLVDAYSGFFGESYRELSVEVERAKATLSRYTRSEYRTAVTSLVEANNALLSQWRELAAVELSSQDFPEDVISELEDLASELIPPFDAKQADMIAAHVSEGVDELLRRWETARSKVQELNHQTQLQNQQLESLRPKQGDKSIGEISSELTHLLATKRRFEDDSRETAEAVVYAEQHKKEVAAAHKVLRAEITDYTETVIRDLGQLINTYLANLNAGFSVDYQPPDFKGKEPAAAYFIVIRGTRVPVRGSDDDTGPSFKTTLSTGDKSVLALALFLASVNADDDLEEKVVVLDDPFTSLDEFRRSFTATEIKKLSRRAKQVILLSHDKTFIRLLWDRLDQHEIACFAIQTGAPHVTTLTPFDIENETRSRAQKERNRVLDYLNGEADEPGMIRFLLRNVLEDFYRKADPEMFTPEEMLGGIVTKVREAPDDYRFKAALDDLDAINFYTRDFHHAPKDGSGLGDDTSEGELRGYCAKVRDLTTGS